jgi:hypothetical protein
MVNGKRLLADLKRLRKRLEEDLRRHHSASRGRSEMEAEWREAFDSKRTADTFETFFTAQLDQAAVHWILGAVFLRFLEDNGLVDRPLISGTGERLELAQERQRIYFRTRPQDSDAEYLIDIFAEVARLPGMAGLFDSAHNPLFQLPLSGDGAMALIGFFRERVPETGALVYDFADPDWETRFLGELYQDLSEDARKRYALLQTPDFIESWILDRTLEPALAEFGLETVRMIDPTCGSGHFLLGGFSRLIAAWEQHDPDMPPAARAQKALDSVAGVDLNPFAVEVARFRLLLAALKAAEGTRLAAAPDFRLNLAVGDSLFHGNHFFLQELGGAEEGFRRLMRHRYHTEDMAELERVLGQQYHAVVGNPPYITPKDAAMREAYREIYASCHRKYGLGAPFTERFFDLALRGKQEQAAGFVGLIVANSFMKREFGKKLIEEVLPNLDLTHVIDCSGAYIPGHGTPTVILFGRNRSPVSVMVRTVRGIRGEPGTPEDPAQGKVWTSIVAQTDLSTSTGEFIGTEDSSREALGAHPWNMGGGGAADVQETIQGERPLLRNIAAVVGIFGMTNADDLMFADVRDFSRAKCEFDAIRSLVVGDAVRDWRITSVASSIFPYHGSNLIQISDIPGIARWMWRARTTLGNRATFGQRTYFQEGRPWWEWHQVAPERLNGPTITLAFVATHNNFVLDRSGNVFNRSAPVIKLPSSATEDDHLALVGLLNSSTGCFWMKQVFYPKGGDKVGQEGARVSQSPWEDRYEFSSTGLERFPLAENAPLDLARTLDTLALTLSVSLPAAVCARAVPTRNALDMARAEAEAARGAMIALQEELDWRCYRLYGLAEDAPEHPDPPALQLGERAFEISMARRMAAGKLETTWFERHRSTPITTLPAHWPGNYRSLVEHRIALIEADPTIGLIERPEYKRRWSIEPWEVQEQEALRLWLLDRLEDPRYWSPQAPVAVTALQLADRARLDGDFLAVAELYAPRRCAIQRADFASAPTGRRHGRSSGRKMRSMLRLPRVEMSSCVLPGFSATHAHRTRPRRLMRRG